MRTILALLAGCVGTLSIGCTGQPHAAPHPTMAADAASATPREGLVLQAGEGEHRVRRTPGKAPFTLKVDQANGGSPQLVMAYEDLPAGYRIEPHRHPSSDEIIFVHRGRAVAMVGTREATVGPGATIYIPRNTRVTLTALGPDSLGIAFIFSGPGFDDVLRANSVREGEPVRPLSPEERAEIRRRYAAHIVQE